MWGRKPNFRFDWSAKYGGFSFKLSGTNEGEDVMRLNKRGFLAKHVAPRVVEIKANEMELGKYSQYAGDTMYVEVEHLGGNEINITAYQKEYDDVEKTMPLNWKDEFRMDKMFVLDGKKVGRPIDVYAAYKKYGKRIFGSDKGLYFLFYHESLVYIGVGDSSINGIGGRIRTHMEDPDKVFTHALWLTKKYLFGRNNVSRLELLEKERQLVRWFTPAWNGQYLISMR